MKFNLEELNPGTKFFFDEDNPEEGSMTVRVCNGAALGDIIKKTTKKKAEFRKGGRHEWREVNEDLQNKLIWDYCIVGWENITDAADKPIECTMENKALLMRGSIQFSRFYAACLEKLNAAVAREREEAEKN